MNIEGAVALISGGASGLGAATAKALVDAGAKVVLADTNEEAGQAHAASLGEANARFIKTDVTSSADVAAAVELATSLGSLRAAVSCAGVGWAARTLKRDGTPHDEELFQKVLSINLFGTFNVIRLAASAMSQNEPIHGERGVLINTASIAAFDGQIGQAAYAASKGGVVGMTLPIARDLSPLGIRVMTIAPGTFDTPMVAGLPDAVRASLGAAVPNPSRLGDPAEYGALALHIIENPYLNAEVIRIDGALRMAPK